MKFIKWLLWLVLFLVIIVAGAAIFLVTTVDPNDLKPQISERVESATGRKLTLDGDLSWQFFPWVGVAINDFALSNRPGFAPEHMLKAEKVDVQVKLMPLLSKQLEIGQVELQSPNINLAVNEKGETNWGDLTGGASQPAEAPEQEAGAMLGGLVVQGVNVSNGDINWVDQSTPEVQQYRLQGFNLSTGVIEPGVPVDIELKTVVSGTALPADAHVALAGSLQLNEAMDVVTLSNFSKKLNMENDSASLEFASLSYSLADGQLQISEIKIEGAMVDMSGALDINQLELAQESGQLELDKMVGKVSMQALNTDADVDIDGLKFALDTQQLNVGELKYSGNYDIFPFQGALSDLRFDVLNSTLQLAQHSVSSKYAELAIEVQGTGLQADLNKQTLNLPELNISAGDALFTASVDASQLLGDVQATGHLASNSFNPRTMLENMGVDALADMPEQAMQALSLESNFSGGFSSIALDGLKVALDQSTLTGQFSMTNFEQPAYRFDLELDQINVDDYLGEEEQAAAEDAGPAAAVLLPFAELKGMDARGEIGIGELRIMDLVSNDIVVKVDAAADRIEVAPLKARAYGGETINTLVYDISGDQPQVAIKSELKTLHLGPFLEAMQITDRFEGVGSVTADISSSGMDLDQATSNLNGKIDIALNDGAIRGVNIQKSLIKAESAFNALAGKDLGLSAELGDKTEFSEFVSKMTIQNGVLNISNVDLKAPALRVAGGGTVDLNTEQLDLELDVSIVKSFEGQGGASLDRLKGQTIPMKISGSLESPSILPDFSQLLRGEVERQLSEKYLGGEDISGEGLNKTLQNKLNEKLAEELGVPAAAGAASTPESGAAATEKAAESGTKSKPPAEPETVPEPKKLEDQLKDELKGKLLKGLFGG